MNEQTLCFVEWPDRAKDCLGDVGLDIFIDYDAEGRLVKLSSKCEWGNRITESVIF